MAYQLKRGIGDIEIPNLDKTDVVIYGLVGFAVLTAFAAFRSAFKRLK